MIYVVTGRTLESARAAVEIAKIKSAPDAVSTFVSRAFPGGIEMRTEQRFRMGDYFDRIEVSDISSDPPSCQIVFHVREGVDSWWKDLISEVLLGVRSAGGITSASTW